VGDTRQLTWHCTCGRRVPLRVNVCHCGLPREAALAAAPPPAYPPASETPGPTTASAVWSTMPNDVRAMALVSALVLVAGVGWVAFGPTRTTLTPAVLGWVDPGPPPVPKPTPPPRPPFKLPWWK
jgi:hypothetical protein